MDVIWYKYIKHYEKLGINPKRICKDGIIDFNEFHKAKPKILFIMKDVNDFEGGDLREWLKEGPRYMWHTIAKWSAGMLNDFPMYEEVVHYDVKKEALKKIAAINLKKSSGKATVAPEIVNAYAHQDRELLLEQIDSIAPDLIISCGVMDQLIWLLDLKVNPEKPSNEPIKDKARNIWVVPFRHPARAGGREVYNKLKEIATKYKGKL